MIKIVEIANFDNIDNFLEKHKGQSISIEIIPEASDENCLKATVIAPQKSWPLKIRRVPN